MNVASPSAVVTSGPPGLPTRIGHALLAPFEDPDLRLPAGLGLLGALVTVLYGIPNRPAGTPTILPFVSGPTPFLTRSPITSALSLAGAVLLAGAWLRIVQVVRERSRAGRTTPASAVLGLSSVWALPFALGPALFSRDIFSYVGQGELVNEGYSPYLTGPRALGVVDQYNLLVDPIWRRTPTPYGPLWIWISSMASRLTGHDPLWAVFLLRLVALASVVAIAWCLLRLARHYEVDPALVLVVGLANPLVLLHLVSGAHNEALVAALMLGGLLLAVRVPDRWGLVGGVALCAAAASVKVPALAAVVFLGWTAAGPAARIGRRLLDVLWCSALAGVVMAVIARVTGVGWGWVETVRNAGGSKSLLAPVRATGLSAAQVARDLGMRWPAAEVREISSLAGLALAGILCLVVLWRARSRVPVVSLGLALFLVTVLGPALFPWYLIPAIVLLAFTRRDLKLALAVVPAALTAVVVLPSGSGVLYNIGPAGSWVVPVLVVIAVAVWAVHRRRTATAGSG
ncbi:MAG: polyprenol phosphomannose-dependent alpha 1,6 mannosyltransferase MptB [Microthrixaceae bacterium]